MINCDRFVEAWYTRAYEKFCKVFKRKWFRCNWVSGSGELWFAVVGYLYNCLYRRSASPATPINVLPTQNEFKDPIPRTELWRLSVKWNSKYAVAEVLLRHGIFVLCLKDTCVQSTVCILCIAIFVPGFLVLVISLSYDTMLLISCCISLVSRAHESFSGYVRNVCRCSMLYK